MYTSNQLLTVLFGFNLNNVDKNDMTIISKKSIILIAWISITQVVNSAFTNRTTNALNVNMQIFPYIL